MAGAGGGAADGDATSADAGRVPGPGIGRTALSQHLRPSERQQSFLFVQPVSKSEAKPGTAAARSRLS